MWWATRLTFHSQRILRHLTRLLLANGEYTEAKRTFFLYVQLLTKGRQTSAGDVSLQLKRRPTSLPAEHPEVIAAQDAAEEENTPVAFAEDIERVRGVGEDGDDDGTFLSMLLLGVRMLCRYGDEEDVIEAKRMLAIARDVVGAATDVETQLTSGTKRWPVVVRASLLTSRGILCARLVDFGESFVILFYDSF